MMIRGSVMKYSGLQDIGCGNRGTADRTLLAVCEISADALLPEWALHDLG